jgi:hypothetical protein
MSTPREKRIGPRIACDIKPTELPERCFDMTERTKSDTQRAGPPPVPLTHVTPEQLARIGEGKVAYLRMMRSEDIRKAFPQAPELAPGLHLFALLSADGTPILLADSRAAALANAWEHELQTVSVH